MAKPKKKLSKPREALPKLPGQTPPAAPPESHAIRETVESIVIAFVLAFLFRTFEAEAFVIPTGSMAPTLMGRHKDVDCPQCGERFRVNASEEDAEETHEMLAELQRGGLSAQDRRRLAASTCLAGMCRNCRYVMPMQPNLPVPVPEQGAGGRVTPRSSYNGDRILVNKYLYTVSDPRRWDVVVFHFPGNAQVNYIKRLVGLPNEVIRVYQGDLFTGASADLPDGAEPPDAAFEIARKPADTVLAMRQLVHDTDHDPAALYEAGWPLRWQVEPSDAAGWKTDAQVAGRNVRQTYSAAADGVAWLRYRHFVPSYETWREVLEQNPAGAARPQLITDFNAYNSRVSDLLVRQNAPPSLKPDPSKLGLHWVGDLMVEADVEIESDEGELLFDLVEAGRHFTATIDLATGRATLAIDGSDEFSPAADTPLAKPGRYHVALANVDDQLLLWVDHKLVDFSDSTRYDAEQLHGSREAVIPRTSDADPGDLAPAGIGARNAQLTVTRLVVWRDIYYIADSWQRQAHSDVVTDFDHPFDRSLLDLPVEPALWNRFRERNHVEFPLAADQYFVMGDNSPESSDARLWAGGDPRSSGRPGGAYLERRQLIGKALCVYWPHSWNRIPGTPIPFPLFPNFGDMRLVR
jgi:signal peptidase I